MEELLVYEVGDGEGNCRIDRYLSEQMEGNSRSFVQKLLKDGKVSISGKSVKASYKVQPGDRIEARVPEPEELEILPEDIPLDILYEDEDLLIVNKPKGMVVHPSAGHYSHTLVNAVLYHCQGQLSGINGVLRPGIVHRIDMDTTGALVVCKNDASHQKLAEQLAVHAITRRYRALVHGNLKEDTGTVTGAIGRQLVAPLSVLPLRQRFDVRVARAQQWQLGLRRLLQLVWHPPRFGTSLFSLGL